MQPPSSRQCSFVGRETDAFGTLCQKRSGPGAARLGVVILHPFLGGGILSIIPGAWSCLSFRCSREHPRVYVRGEHRDHVRDMHQGAAGCRAWPELRCCSKNSRTVETHELFSLG